MNTSMHYETPAIYFVGTAVEIFLGATHTGTDAFKSPSHCV